MERVKKQFQTWAPLIATFVALTVGAFVWASDQHTDLSDRCMETVEKSEKRAGAVYTTKVQAINTQGMVRENTRGIKRLSDKMDRIESKIDALIDRLIDK